MVVTICASCSVSLQEVFCYLLRLRPFWLLVLAGSVRNIPGYALGAWLPTFIVLKYRANSREYGIRVGLVVLFGGALGSFVGGFLSDRQVKVISVIMCVGCAHALLYPLSSPFPWHAWTWTIVPSLLYRHPKKNDELEMVR